jgi:hypothetical protein
MMSAENIGPPSKRKKSDRDRDSVKNICIVHVDGLKYDDIILISASKDPQERLSNVQEICRRRLAQPVGSAQRMEDSCSLVPDALLPHHGYHRVCYQRFTANLDRLKDVPADSLPPASRASRTSSADRVIFKPDCIFCNSESRKKIKVKGDRKSVV